MARRLILDDDPERWLQFQADFADDELVWVSDSAKCIELLETDDFDYVYLDHDLHHPDNGMEVVEWIEENCDDPSLDRVRFIIHSWNVDRADEMLKRITDVGVYAVMQTYHALFGFKGTLEFAHAFV